MKDIDLIAHRSSDRTPYHNGGLTLIPLAACLFLASCLTDSPAHVTPTPSNNHVSSILVKHVSCVVAQLKSHTKALLLLARGPDGRMQASAPWDKATVLHVRRRSRRVTSPISRLCFELSGAVFPPFRTHPPSHRTRRICDRRGCVTGATGLGDTA